MKVQNQKPATLSPVYTAKITGDFAEQTEKAMLNMVSPIFTPITPSQPVIIKNNNKDITANDLVDNIINCCGDIVDSVSENLVKTVFEKTLLNYGSNNMLVQDTFAVQSANAENTKNKKTVLPLPSTAVAYTPSTDIIPVSKMFIANKCSYDMLFATYAFYTRANTLGFYFTCEQDFEDFKAWFKNATQILIGTVTTETKQLIDDFDKIQLNGLTESIIIRNDDTDNTNEYSFARIIVSYLMNYTKVKTQNEFGVFPFSIGELFIPKTIVFVNIEQHAKAQPSKIREEWNMIKSALEMKPQIFSNKQISKMTSVVRNAQKLAKMASQMQQCNMNIKATRRAFRKTPLTSVDITNVIKNVIKHMAQINRSENTFKKTKTTYLKPNRREPDNFNKKGVMVSTKYKPDIHLYIDTSGSISERNYQDAIKSCIMLAKKLNINLYFNSFSHIMSQTTKLNTKDKSKKMIYNQFRKVPKVSGGTNYAQIWEYINKSKKRQNELSLIITDFCYKAPSRYIEHPKNLYYLPCSKMSWIDIKQEAEMFEKSMLHNDANIRKKILM